MVSAEITSERSTNSSSLIDARPGSGEVFSHSNIPSRDRLPLLIGTSLTGIIIASGWVSHRGAKESSLEPGRQRLQNLTQQWLQYRSSLPLLSLTKL